MIIPSWQNQKYVCKISVISIHLDIKQKNSLLTNEEYNTSEVTDLKDEHHDIYEKEEDKPSVWLFIRFTMQFTYILKSYQNMQEKVLALVKFRVGQTATLTKT